MIAQICYIYMYAYGKKMQKKVYGENENGNNGLNLKKQTKYNATKTFFFCKM